MHKGSIVILDFGGQYAHLIGSRIRRFGAYSEIKPADVSLEELQDVAGIILSGGPQSVYDEGSPQADKRIFELGVPVLGICYGMHWMATALDGKVSEGHTKEYGRTPISRTNGGGGILVDDRSTIWMSHGDEVSQLPEGFVQIATSDSCKNAAMYHPDKNFFALQFHPEVTHSEGGFDMLQRFVDICDAKPWSISSYADFIGEQIKEKVGDRKVFMLVSGGVDSSVAFVLLNKLLGPERVQGLLVDHGLMRKGEAQMVHTAFSEFGYHNLRIEDASDEFFANLEGVSDPEKKRLIIGQSFLDVQKRVSEEMNLRAEDGWMLGQGTIYPDTIETGSTKHADKIKTHHNVIPAIQKMHEQGLVIEPLRDLYKDEVRMLGEEIGLPHDLVWRHPFPGPGLGVRILCSEGVAENDAIEITESFTSTVLPVKSVGVQGDGRTYRHAVALFSDTPCDVPSEHFDAATRIPNSNPDISRVLQCISHSEPVDFVLHKKYCVLQRANLLREADAIVDEEMRKADLYESIWQFPVVLIPCGISDGESIVLRPIESTDAMTADATRVPQHVLEAMSNRLMALEGIEAVFYDLTSKPPGTIEWE